MSEIFTKSSDGFQINKFDVAKGEVQAVVTSFKNADVVNDVIQPGALDGFIKQFGGALPMLFQHDKNEMIGVWNKLEVVGDEVIGTGNIFPEVSRGKDTMALISRGMIGATSIGFKSADYEKNDIGGFNFKEIELVEISMVRSPANPRAQLMSAKDDAGAIDIRKVENILRDAGLSRKESRALIAEGKSALRDVVEQDTDLSLLVAGAIKLL